MTIEELLRNEELAECLRIWGERNYWFGEDDGICDEYTLDDFTRELREAIEFYTELCEDGYYVNKIELAPASLSGKFEFRLKLKKKGKATETRDLDIDRWGHICEILYALVYLYEHDEPYRTYNLRGLETQVMDDYDFCCHLDALAENSEFDFKYSLSPVSPVSPPKAENDDERIVVENGNEGLAEAQPLFFLSKKPTFANECYRKLCDKGCFKYYSGVRDEPKQKAAWDYICGRNHDRETFCSIIWRKSVKRLAAVMTEIYLKNHRTRVKWKEVYAAFRLKSGPLNYDSLKSTKKTLYQSPDVNDRLIIEWAKEIVQS